MTTPKVEALSLHLAENKLQGEDCSTLPLLCIVLNRLSLSLSLSFRDTLKEEELPYGCSEARRPKGALHWSVNPIGFAIKYLQPGARGLGMKLHPHECSRLRKRNSKAAVYIPVLIISKNFVVNGFDKQIPFVSMQINRIIGCIRSPIRTIFVLNAD